MDARLVRYDRLAPCEQRLLLIRRLVTEPAPPARRRSWLLEYCRRAGTDERPIWRALARYRQAGAAGLLTEDRTDPTVFDRRAALVRQHLLSLLIAAPPCLLNDFQPLARLLELLGDRLQFVCGWVLEFFLDPSTWADPEPDQVESACAVLLNKLEEELDRLRAVLDQSPGVSLAAVCCDYRESLWHRAVAGEHEDLP